MPRMPAYLPQRVWYKEIQMFGGKAKKNRFRAVWSPAVSNLQEIVPQLWRSTHVDQRSPRRPSLELFGFAPPVGGLCNRIRQRNNRTGRVCVCVCVRTQQLTKIFWLMQECCEMKIEESEKAGSYWWLNPEHHLAWRAIVCRLNHSMKLEVEPLALYYGDNSILLSKYVNGQYQTNSWCLPI